jgi:uncharacterized FAD-dependent dehydrogenase
MKKIISLRIKPPEAADSNFINQLIATEAGTPVNSVSGYTILKRSIDARSRQVFINLSIEAFIGEPYLKRQINKVHFRDVSKVSRQVIIIGAGPAGLFAALQLIEKGIKPILLERGRM